MLLFAEAYEAFMKKQDETYRTEVMTTVVEPKLADVPTVAETVSEKEMIMQRRMAQQSQMMQSFISEQVPV